MGRRGDRRARRRRIIRRRLAALAVVSIVIGAAGFAIWESRPPFLDRALYPLRYETIIRAHARTYKLDPALLAAVVYAESRFDPGARSSAGAVGLMQLLPSTGQAIADRTGNAGFVVDDLLAPELNLRYGSWYLRNLLDRYEGELDTALAAYHAGPTRVDGWRKRGVGVQFPETRAYVKNVRSARAVYARAYKDELGL
jgi:soluble lytic murein transglycosylase